MSDETLLAFEQGIAAGEKRAREHQAQGAPQSAARLLYGHAVADCPEFRDLIGPDEYLRFVFLSAYVSSYAATWQPADAEAAIAWRAEALPVLQGLRAHFASESLYGARKSHRDGARDICGILDALIASATPGASQQSGKAER